MENNKLNLLFGNKGAILCSKIFSIQNRFPSFFPKYILRELGSFLAACTETFLISHEDLVLIRIFFSYHRLIKNAKGNTQQKIHTTTLRVSPSVYGIILLAPLGSHEGLNERYILKGIHNLIAGIKPIPNSYFSFQNKKMHFFYLEIKKMRGGVFSSEEKKKLHSELWMELQKKIENVFPLLFLPGKEEELFKNIRHLSQELKYVRDLPQVMISFIEYSRGTLKFLVTVLRIIKPTAATLLTLSSQLPSCVQFSLESVFCVERLRKKYPKEASVFTLEVSDSFFLRDNESVNLRAARQYIGKVLESMLGPFRDYNGGLLNKENEQLISIKRALEKRGIFFPLLEELFYGIKPITMRPLISTQTGIALILLFQKIVLEELDENQKFCHKSQHTDEAHLVVIKTKEKELKTTLAQHFFNAQEVGYSSLELGGYFYFFFFQQHPKSNFLLNTIEKELKHPSLNSQARGTLHLNFQGGDPPSLNPRLATDIHSHTLCSFLFEGLTQINHSGKIEMATAEKMDISLSRTSYTFYLRRSSWSNGEEVTAYHFEKTWKKALLATPNSMCPDFFAPIKNVRKAVSQASAIDSVGIHAKDAKTLVVELESPCPHFLNLVSTPPFFPLFGDAEEPTDFNGPFTVTERKEDVSLSLSSNPFYWDAQRIKLGGIHVSMIQDAFHAYQLFKEGKLDLIGDPMSPLPFEILKKAKVHRHLHYKPISRVFWIHCNPQCFPLHNVDFRKALSLSIDRTHLSKKVFIGQIPHSSLLPSKYTSFEETNLDGNLEKAVEHFDKALEALHLDSKHLPSLTITHSDLSFEKNLIQELKRQWKSALGIEVLSKELPWYEFSASLEQGNFQLGGLFRRDLFSHPMFYLGFFKHSPYNSHSLDNKEYEHLLEAYYQGENQNEILKQIEQLLMQETPVISLVTQRYLYLVNKRVKGVEWNSNGCIDLKKVYLNETHQKHPYLIPSNELI